MFKPGYITDIQAIRKKDVQSRHLRTQYPVRDDLVVSGTLSPLHGLDNIHAVAIVQARGCPHRAGDDFGVYGYGYAGVVRAEVHRGQQIGQG